ncbi:hypothetical protein [Sphingopyxis sp.]|uniref:hypothetical protein n=1 Tax=Sphingopyxis sp. TaxID=1908224 RepID=UPI003D0C37DF
MTDPSCCPPRSGTNVARRCDLFGILGVPWKGGIVTGPIRLPAVEGVSAEKKWRAVSRSTKDTNIIPIEGDEMKRTTTISLELCEIPSNLSSPKDIDPLF